MTYAITAAAQTTAPVTWTSNGTVITVNWPTGYHAAYVDAQHTATVVQLADTGTVVQPATAVQTSSAGGAIGLSGATLLGLGIVVYFASKWKHHAKEVKRSFILGAVATILVGSWGLFGTVTQTVKSTGDSVGGSINNTIGQQSSYTSR